MDPSAILIAVAVLGGVGLAFGALIDLLEGKELTGLGGS